MYNLEQLKMFVETADAGSFSACAKRLGKVQSAISQGIANLELDLDCQLFDRSTRKPTLTPAGGRLLEYAHAILLQNQEFKSTAQALREGHETSLTLALDSCLLLPKLTEQLLTFSQLFPSTTFNLLTGSSSEVLNWVLNDHADAGLMFADPDFHRGVNLGFIGNLPFYGMVHKDHVLANFEVLSETQLINHKQIMAKDWQIKGGGQFVPLGPDNWYANNYHDVKTLIKQGLGWGYLPEHLAEQELTSGEMVILNLSFDLKPWNPPLDRITPKSKTMGPALTWLSNALTQSIE